MEGEWKAERMKGAFGVGLKEWKQTVVTSDVWCCSQRECELRW